MEQASPFGLTAWSALTDALTDARETREAARAASGAAKDVAGGVTASIIALADEMREKTIPVTLGSRDGSTQSILYAALAAYQDKGQASKVAQLVCWLALYPEHVPVCVKARTEEGKVTFLGYIAAHRKVRDSITPPQRTYKDLLADLAAILGDADPDTQRRAAMISPDSVVSFINRYYMGEPEIPGNQMADAMAGALVESMKRDAALNAEARAAA